MTKLAIASCSTEDTAWLPAGRAVPLEHSGLTLLLSDGDRIVGVRCGRHLKADHYVLAMAATHALLKTLSIDIPVYPVKGYSLTDC